MLNLRCILLCYQVVLGFNINLTKPKMVRLDSRRDETRLASVSDCTTIELPIKYLELPLGSSYKDEKMWGPMIEKFERRLAGWKKNLLSKGIRLSLVKSMLADLPIYYISLMTILVKVAKKLESI